MMDAAYWMKGCSSLGLTRIAAIAEWRDDEGVREHALVDIKQAIAPIAPAAHRVKMPDVPAERVVAAAQALSPHLGERIVAARVLDASVLVRELMPQDLKLEVAQFSTGQAIRAAHYVAFVVGKAHARQMADDDRQSWRSELSKGRTSLDAPSWLWESVVALAGMHETAYLEHCRQYALKTVA